MRRAKTVFLLFASFCFFFSFFFFLFFVFFRTKGTSSSFFRERIEIFEHVKSPRNIHSRVRFVYYLLLLLRLGGVFTFSDPILL